MPLTPEQLAKMAQKDNATPDALKRNASTNYFEGHFFITLNTRDYAPILSSVAGNPDAPDDAPDAPRCEYTDLGRRVMGVWQTIPRFHPDVEIIAAEAMPDHFHGLLCLKPGNRKHLGRMVNGFMIACTHDYWDTLGIDWRAMKKDPNKSERDASREWFDRDHTRSYRGPSLFVRGYNDMEAITPEQVQIKLRYIKEQARRALIKGALRDRFSIHRSCTARGWTLDALRRGLCADRFLANDEPRLEAALKGLLPRILMQHDAAAPAAASPAAASPAAPAASPAAALAAASPAVPAAAPSTAPPAAASPSACSALSGHLFSRPVLSYVGCSALLFSSRKLPLVCHRSDAPFFERQREAVLCAAREGAVIVSAFISAREREIKKLLLMEQLPVVEVMDNGFAERYKPAGQSFYACAENRLVQITPWTYAFNRNNSITREMCLVMNQLVRTICGVDDGWWKGF